MRTAPIVWLAASAAACTAASETPAAHRRHRVHGRLRRSGRLAAAQHRPRRARADARGGPGTAENCAYLDGGPGDLFDHHNLLSMYDGYLLMPWAPEWGGGGLTLWDLSAPCDPVVVGSGESPNMRETHAIGYAFEGGQWAVTNAIAGFTEGGAQFWDISDPLEPEAVSMVNVEGFVYPDAYARVSLSVFWQDPYVFVGGADNGVYVVDASDPLAPEVVAQYVFEPILRVGQVAAVGPLLIATEAEGARTALLDISDPTDSAAHRRRGLPRPRRRGHRQRGVRLQHRRRLPVLRAQGRRRRRHDLRHPRPERARVRGQRHERRQRRLRLRQGGPRVRRREQLRRGLRRLGPDRALPGDRRVRADGGVSTR